MDTELGPTFVGQPSLVSRGLRGLAFIFAAILLAFALAEIQKLTAPEVPVGWIYAGIGIAAVTLVLQWPTLYYRLPRSGRRATSWLLLVTLVTVVVVDAGVRPAWEATPAGKAEAVQRAQSEHEQAARDAIEARDRAARESADRLRAEATATVERLEDKNEKLEGCFSWGHRLPALEDPVKASLHNPDAFEHVETVLTTPDAGSNNVVMRFRAENGFGAIRTAEVRAQLLADDCSIQNIGQPSVD